MSVQNFLDECPNYSDITETTVIVWGRPGVGFGEVVFYKEDGALKCDNEGMSPEFIKEVLCDLVDKATFE